jgi:hypothetical protein
MDIATAVAHVKDLADENDIPVLEQLMDMQANLDMYSKESRVAYRVFMIAGAAMFAPVDTAAD